jgi:hypothetical protein
MENAGMETARWRRDGTVGNDIEFKMIFAWQLPASGRTIREGLLMLYSLTPQDGREPMIYAPGMTHEFTVYEVDPETPIDFERSLFEQKQVSPLVPAVVGFQFRASGSKAAIDRVEDLVNRIVRMELPPDVPTEWLPFMRDGVDIAAELLDVGQVIEKSNVERKVGGERLAIPDEMKKRYRFEKAPTTKAKVAWTTGLVAAGALLAVAGVYALFGVDPDMFFVNAGAVAENMFQRDLEMPDGKTYRVVLQHDHAKDARTLKVLSINKAGAVATDVAALTELAALLGSQQIEALTDAIHEKYQDVFERDIVMQDGRVYRTKMRKVPGAPGRYEVIAREEIEGASPDLGTKQD